MARKFHFGDNNFTNFSDEVVTVRLEPGEIVELRLPNSSRCEVGRFDGGEFGDEVEVEPGGRVTVVGYR